MVRLISNLGIIARYVLGLVFLLVGASMIDQYALAQAYMVSTGLPGALLPWFILAVIASAFALVSGSRLQWAALVLALLALASALLLPADFVDHAQSNDFFRNVSIASVLLLIAGVMAGCRGTARQASITDRLMRIKHSLLTNRS